MSDLYCKGVKNSKGLTIQQGHCEAFTCTRQDNSLVDVLESQLLFDLENTDQKNTKCFTDAGHRVSKI